MHSWLVRRHRVPLSEGFASVVERRRKAKRLSRAALAAKAGVHQTYVGLLERGERSPNLDTAQAIAKSLGFRLSRLIKQSERAQQRAQNKKRHR
jgi:transcriptional regulator with XRE-family HTH domain